MILEILAFIIIAVELYEILKHYKKDNIILYEIILLLVIGLIFMTSYTLIKIIILLICSFFTHAILSEDKKGLDEDYPDKKSCYLKDNDEDTSIQNNEIISDNSYAENIIENNELSNDEKTEENENIPIIKNEEKTIEKREITHKIDINQADLEDLALLPNISKIKAKKIIVYREAGNYITSYDDLKEKLFLDDKQIEEIKEFSIIKDIYD